MGKRFTFLSLIMLLLLGRTMAQSVDIIFNDSTVNSYKLKFTVIEGTNGCSVKISRPATELTALEIPTKVTIQNSDYYVTEIDSVAFRNCTKFSSVSLPDSLKMIRGRAFYNCSGLTGDLIIPDNVTYIGEYAFYGCYNIKGSLKLSEKLVTIGRYAFSRNSANNTNMGFSGSLVIPNNVKTIGHYAFNYCTNFRGSLNMSESLTSIGDYAFYYCEGFNKTKNQTSYIKHQIITLSLSKRIFCFPFRVLPHNPTETNHSFHFPLRKDLHTCVALPPNRKKLDQLPLCHSKPRFRYLHRKAQVHVMSNHKTQICLQER